MSVFRKTFAVARDLGITILSAIEESANENRELKQKYEAMSDQELLKVVHNDGFFGHSRKQKGAAFSVLRHRGFSVEDINSRKPV